jgi:tetratricopeptide (TPR) repeat protein
MNQYKRINIIGGWVVFTISLVVYLLTIEPTVSLWDCGEFIASSVKLEVGHPPGAPLFMMLGRFFSLFGFDASNSAMMMNAMSAMASAFTILFLFWTITHLAQKFFNKGGKITTGKIAAVIGSGVVGALAYTFSDTFWFSAVEAEVYAFSSFFTAIVFWAILKWENEADKLHANRWIILIAYLMGLSIGVHLLNLLAIPAIVLVYYFRKYEATRNGVLLALLTGVIILGFVMYGIIPGLPFVSGLFELMFVNGFGLPYHSGVLFFLALVIAGIVWALRYTYRKQKVIMNTIVLSVTMILIGYSTFAIIVIRSSADTPMNENAPDNVFALTNYLNREQYGSRPLFVGQDYSSPVVNIKENQTYVKQKGKYVKSYLGTEYVFHKDYLSLFPRMWSDNGSHKKEYIKWAKVKGKRRIYRMPNGEKRVIIQPTFGENLRYMFSYQFWHMYGRYFMWNFAGRQNDIQSHGEIINGNWISGIGFIDEWRLGPQDNLPEEYANNTARNKYYFLPLILGLLGMIFHFLKDKKNFWVVAMVFFMTGIAIVLYLNQYPLQPRERDYAYAGSFYAFAIWIGLGVIGIIEAVKSGKRLPKAVAVSAVCLVFVPGIMAVENWDDHDRSGRYSALDFAKNYLNTCEPNALIFTNGDNDTFPLWYAQEVEGIRTDVRVVNMSLLNMDWYIDQMKNKVYESDPLPISMTHDQYIQGMRDRVIVYDKLEEYQNISDVVAFIASDNPRTFVGAPGEEESFIPAKNISIPVDVDKVIKNGTVKPELRDSVVNEIRFTIKDNVISKAQMIILDILANNNWERPVYFVSNAGDSNIGLSDFLQLDGVAWRLVPIKTTTKDYTNVGRIDPDILYNNLVKKFEYGRLNEDDVLCDFYNIRTFSVLRLRNKFARLANEFTKRGDRDKAIEVLEHAEKIMPSNKIPYGMFVAPMVDAYYKAGRRDKAEELAKEAIFSTRSKLDYFQRIVESKGKQDFRYEVDICMTILQDMLKVGEENRSDFYTKTDKKFKEYYDFFYR